MKRTTCIIVAVIGLASLGSAGAHERQLEAVSVRSSSSLDCAPPNDSQLCSVWHAEIRRNFTTREIGMLFNAATPYAEYKTVYSSVKKRYDRLAGEFAATHASADAVASR